LDSGVASAQGADNTNNNSSGDSLRTIVVVVVVSIVVMISIVFFAVYVFWIRLNKLQRETAEKLSSFYGNVKEGSMTTAMSPPRARTFPSAPSPVAMADLKEVDVDVSME
jgi:ABC-type siderophore export system fused ATPase/permease subunit